MASSHLRHQDSLEGLLNVPSSPLLAPEVRQRALARFNAIIEAFSPEGASQKEKDYDRTALLGAMYQYSLTAKSKECFLKMFFRSIEISITDDEEIDLVNSESRREIWLKLVGFADFLFNNFFLPLKASTRQTPQPSPAYDSATQISGTGRANFVPMTARLKSLRGLCLQRDHHRCVISRSFDSDAALKRFKTFGDDAQDDDGQPLTEATVDFLEVAHILPHSLATRLSDSRLSESREMALRILNMFDTNVSHLIEGNDIDRPRNAISLTASLHKYFGDFRVYFEPEEHENTYRILKNLPGNFFKFLPTTQKLLLTPERSIEPPSPRLLAVHRAIACILRASGAGEYIDEILRDLEFLDVQADGSTYLGQLVQLKMDGWIRGAGHGA